MIFLYKKLYIYIIGYGMGIVIGTGKNTEFGAIFTMVNEVESKKTPLQEKMDELGKQLSAFSIGIILIIVIIGVFEGKNWLEMFNVGGKYFLLLLLFIILYNFFTYFNFYNS